MAGLRVKVVERRKVAGGAAVTEEFHPGFRNSVAAYTVSLLNPQIICGSQAARSRPADRRAPRAEFPARPRRQLSADRRRPHPAIRGQTQRARRRQARRVQPRTRSDRRRAARLRAARAAEPGRGIWRRRDPRGLQRARHRQHPARAVAGAAALAARPVHALGRRDAGRRLRERSGQGAVRLRRHRRQLRQPLRGGLGLCDAASCLRRGERQEGRLGPRHRRHGRDHAGDGARRARPWRRDRARCRRARGDRRARPRRRRHPRQWRDHPRQICRLQRQPETAVYAAGAGGRAAAAISRSHQELAQRLRHLPDECRAERACPRSPRCPAPAIISPPASSSRPSLGYMDRAWQDARDAWLEPRAGGRGSDPLDAGRYAGARRASMSPACSASTSRRNCRTANPGTIIARRSPIS